MKKYFFLIPITFLTNILQAQTSVTKPDTYEKKKINAKVIQHGISIDGKLDDEGWNGAEIAKNFVMLQPENGTPLDHSKETIVKVLYDDNAIYIGAELKDDPSKIMKQITQRDDDGSADFFGLSVNGYNDGQQEFRFFVTAAGVQLDANANSSTGEDFSWDAIWESKVQIHDGGWTVEIKLPYSALRFPKQENQTWGIQFFRQIRRDRQLYSWNFVDNNKGSLEQQSGLLTGIQNINPPTRLFLFPYASYYVNQNAGESKPNDQFKFGMDLKYGISDAFTLDAILIPDFGQTAVDNKILNLGPFEQQFNENRPFFTEGTELFNKGNLVYSRRIGGFPSYYPETESDEEILNYPNQVNLLNALKVSGRTKKGLGVGVLNAITEKTDVLIRKTEKDPITDEIISVTDRKETIEPLTNYNVLVFDQRFGGNSSISFVNTNVTRNGDFRDGNASALVFDLTNKKNTFNFSGSSKTTIVNEKGSGNDSKFGYANQFSLSDVAGKYRYTFAGGQVSKDFDNNDLGINFQTNYYHFSAWGGYRLLKPTKKLNGFNLNLNNYTQFHNESGKLQEINFNANTWITLKSNDSFGMGINAKPFKRYDYYSAFTEGRYVVLPNYYSSWAMLSSNYNRKFAIDLNPWIGFTTENRRNEYGGDITPRYRISDKLLLIAGYSYTKERGDKGYVTTQSDNTIVFGQRDNTNSVITLQGNYSINNKMTVKLTSRYYWRYVEYLKYQKLEENGYLTDYAYTNPSNRDFTSWNFDLAYSWWFAPGSQINFLYRNNALNSLGGLHSVDKNVSNNVDNLFKDNLNHTISLSVRYFIDYNRVKNWF